MSSRKVSNISKLNNFFWTTKVEIAGDSVESVKCGQKLKAYLLFSPKEKGKHISLLL